MKDNEFYESPQVSVVGVTAQQIVCSSKFNAGNNGYTSNDYEW